MKNLSLYTLVVMMLLMFVLHTFYYPKWKLERTEATIGWDVAGYYIYLPALFIYQDLGNLDFEKDIVSKYQPNPSGIQAIPHKKTGNKVIKYSCGMALVYSPFFFLAHSWAQFSSYPADGFSFPYQFMISFGSLGIAFLGLFYLRKFLRLFFEELPVSLTLVSLVLASNYLDYAAINTAMSHNYLFTIYSLMLWNTYWYYEKEQPWKNAIGIGLLAGLAALIRPTDILIIIIPILWNIQPFSFASIKERSLFFWKNRLQLFVAIALCLLVGSIQFIYWKLIGGEWIIYSYKGEGFSWLSPHLVDGWFSYKTGWLLYSPIFYLALMGWGIAFFKKKTWRWGLLVYFILFSYVVLAWDNWWYGGGLGLRAMVQSYPVLAIVLAVFWSTISKQVILKSLGGGVLVLFSYYNLWLTHQAHKGGLLPAAQVTRAYYWSILGRYEIDESVKKLLDTDELFRGKPQNMERFYQNSYEDNRFVVPSPFAAIKGEGSELLSNDQQYTGTITIPLKKVNLKDWIRIKALYQQPQKEWEVWKMPQLIVQLKSKGVVIKERILRISRFLKGGENTESLYFDVQLPKKKTIDELSIMYWNAGGQKILLIDELECFSFE